MTSEKDVRMGRLLGRKGIPPGLGRKERRLKAEAEENISDGGNGLHRLV